MTVCTENMCVKKSWTVYNKEDIKFNNQIKKIIPIDAFPIEIYGNIFEINKEKKTCKIFLDMNSLHIILTVSKLINDKYNKMTGSNINSCNIFNNTITIKIDENIVNKDVKKKKYIIKPNNIYIDKFSTLNWIM